MKRCIALLLTALMMLSSAAMATDNQGVTVEQFEAGYTSYLDMISSVLPIDQSVFAFEKLDLENGTKKLYVIKESFEIWGYTFADSDIVDSVVVVPKTMNIQAELTTYLPGFFCAVNQEEATPDTLTNMVKTLGGAKAQLEAGSPYGSYAESGYTYYIWDDGQDAYYLLQNDQSEIKGEYFQNVFGLIHPTEQADQGAGNEAVDEGAQNMQEEVPAAEDLGTAEPTVDPQPTPQPTAIAITSSYDFAPLSDEELLGFWNSVGVELKERGAYPYTQLSKGDISIDVTNMQKRLAELYYYTGDLTGTYNENTLKAVKAFEKANDIPEDGKMSIDNLDLLYSDAAIAKTTPTPSPSPTPGPTPVVDSHALQITDVSLRERSNTKVFSIDMKNCSEDDTIDAFTVKHRVYDTYGDLLSEGVAEWWKELSLKPGKSFSMGSYYWYLFGEQTASRIDVAVMKYHTTDGKTVAIDEEDYVWVEGNL